MLCKVTLNISNGAFTQTLKMLYYYVYDDLSCHYCNICVALPAMTGHWNFPLEYLMLNNAPLTYTPIQVTVEHMFCNNCICTTSISFDVTSQSEKIISSSATHDLTCRVWPGHVLHVIMSSKYLHHLFHPHLQGNTQCNLIPNVCTSLWITVSTLLKILLCNPFIDTTAMTGHWNFPLNTKGTMLLYNTPHHILIFKCQLSICVVIYCVYDLPQLLLWSVSIIWSSAMTCRVWPDHIYTVYVVM